MVQNKITAVVITYNEERNIENCLKSLTWCDELIIVDSFSNDRTLEIASRYTKNIYQHKWPGFAKQKNYALQFVDTDWVLFLDADEYVTKDFESQIRNLINNSNNYVAFFTPRKSSFLGKWLRYTDQWPQYMVRLFKVGCAKWEDREIHEQVEVNGKAGYMSVPIIHNNPKNETLEAFLHDTIRNANYETKERFKRKYGLKKKFSIKNASLRMIIKHFSYYLPFKPVLRFVYLYFIRLGFLDGPHGLLWSIYHGFIYEMLVTTKLWEIKIRNRINQSDNIKK